jgi:glycosyltransferase involved in cell wall biosynthesis
MWDDCSTDNSVELIENWIADNQIDCIFIKHKKNRGICQSLNEAFSYAKGKYFQGVAMDDILLPDKIERHVKILENATDRDALVFTDAYLINSESKFYPNYFLAYHISKYIGINSGNFYNKLLIHNFIPAMSILYKTEIIKEMNGWDENLAYEDYDMLLRIAKRYDFIFDKKISVKYRLHEYNTHKINKIENNDEMKVFSKHIMHPTAQEHCLRVLKKFYTEKSPYLHECKKIYFNVQKANSLFLICVKYNIPNRLYLLFKLLMPNVKK